MKEEKNERRERGKERKIYRMREKFKDERETSTRVEGRKKRDKKGGETKGKAGRREKEK